MFVRALHSLAIAAGRGSEGPTGPSEPGRPRPARGYVPHWPSAMVPLDGRSHCLFQTTPCGGFITTSPKLNKTVTNPRHPVPQSDHTIPVNKFYNLPHHGVFTVSGLPASVFARTDHWPADLKASGARLENHRNINSVIRRSVFRPGIRRSYDQSW